MGVQQTVLTTDCVHGRDSVDDAPARSHWGSDPVSPSTFQTGRQAACRDHDVCTLNGERKRKNNKPFTIRESFGFYSLAIAHGEVLAAALEKVTIVVARGAVTATLSIVLQYLLKEFRAIAIEDR